MLELNILLQSREEILSNYCQGLCFVSFDDRSVTYV